MEPFWGTDLANGCSVSTVTVHLQTATNKFYKFHSRASCLKGIEGVRRQWLNNKGNPAGRACSTGNMLHTPGCSGQSFRSVELESHNQDFLLTASIVIGISANSVLGAVPNLGPEYHLLDDSPPLFALRHNITCPFTILSCRQDFEAITSRFMGLFLTFSSPVPTHQPTLFPIIHQEMYHKKYY